MDDKLMVDTENKGKVDDHGFQMERNTVLSTTHRELIACGYSWKTLPLL